MNLPLHTGLLGALEACLIAFLIGVLVYALWAWVCRRGGLTVAHAVGWGLRSRSPSPPGWTAGTCSLGMSRLESPLYARLALAGIHDPDFLGVRVLLQIIGAMTGTVAGWWLFSGRLAGHDREHAADTSADTDKPLD